MTGKVCDKHQEWCPTGECRWCAPPPEPPRPARTATEAAIFARVAHERIEAAKRLMYLGLLFHYPSCPLKGIIGDRAHDLAAGCTCVPFP